MKKTEMLIDIETCASVLKDADNILLLTHSHPDGDTIGSAGALALALRQLGKTCVVACGDRISPKFDFLLETVPMTGSFDVELIVAVDVADPKLLGDEFNALYGEDVDLCIDHHASNIDYARSLWLDGESASAAEMVFELLKVLGTEITPEIASLLFTGVSTDTGCFRFSNTTARTHLAAAELIKLGAQSHRIIKDFFETKTKAYAALERLCLNEMKFFLDGRCAVMPVTRAMLEKTGADAGDIEGLSNLPRQVEGVLVGVTMREQPNGAFKCSVRTHGDIDASDICKRLGGGGHIGAAGCMVGAPLNAAIGLLVSEIEKELNQ